MKRPELPPHAKRAGASLLVVGAVLLAAEHAGRALLFAQGIVEAAIRTAGRWLEEADAGDDPRAASPAAIDFDALRARGEG